MDPDLIGPPAPIEVAAPTQPQRLYGLQYILDARNMGRKLLARDININFRRFYAIVALNTRAEPHEIIKLQEVLNVSLADLITVPENAPPPRKHNRGGRRRKAIADTDDNTVYPPPDSDPEMEEGSEPKAIALQADPTTNRRATIKGFTADKNNQPVLKTNKGDQMLTRTDTPDITLNINLPDGRRFSVSTNQPPSANMLQRMSQALAVLIAETE